MREIRIISTISLLLVGVAGIVSWFVGYSDRAHVAHATLFVVAWTFAFLGIVAAAGTLIGCIHYEYKVNESFWATLLGVSAAFILLGAGVVAAIVGTSLSNYGDGGGTIVASATLGYVAGYCICLLVSLAFAGREEWLWPRDQHEADIRRITQMH